MDLDRAGPQLELDAPIRVRPQDARPTGLDPGDRRRRRVSVRIAEAGRDDRDAGTGCGEERLGRGRARAVVGDLQDLDCGQRPREERRVDLLLDVAGQEEAVARSLAEEHDRDVVDARPAVRRRLGHAAEIRPQDPELDVVDGEAIPGHEDATLDPAGGEGGAQGHVAGSGADHSRFEDPLHAIPVEEAGQPGRVVLVRVAQDDDIDAPVPRREVLVEGDEEPSGIGPAVDEEAGAALALEEDRIALADVEDGQPGHAVGSMDDGDRQRHDRRREAPGEGPLEVALRSPNPQP